MVRLSLRLPVETEAAAAARHCVESLERVLEPAELENVKLLVSELVTNSLRHAGLERGDWVEVDVAADEECVHVEVWDPGAGFQAGPGREAPVELSHGWGLYLVDRIAHRWGVDRDGRQTGVWFELGRSPTFGAGGDRR